MSGIRLPQRRLVSQNDAAIIQDARVPRSVFNNTWTRKTAFNAGYLVPILVDEILPGDHMTYDVTAYVRMSTPLFPIFDNQRIDTHFFFVPNRLVWENWVKLMGEQTDPDSSIDYQVPVYTTANGGDPVGSVSDHMGIPPLGCLAPGESVEVGVLPFRMYNLIYNTWFRDQNLVDSATVRLDDSDEVLADFPMRQRAKSHDYFTSALPWPQKFTAPTVPLGGLAPILGLGTLDTAIGGGGTQNPVYETDGTTDVYSQSRALYDATANNQVFMKIRQDGANYYPAVYADLSQATGVAINTLRNAWMIQTLLERDARGGTRYVEKIRSHFGVTNPDFRLQRPEYIGGGQTPLSITPVAQTAPTEDAPLGALGAAGTAAGQHRASYAATEHGYVIGLLSVKTELSYQQGIDRHWFRRTQYDFYTPELGGLGEQSIRRQEIFAQGTGDDLTIFGYQERWHEYRTRQSDVTGLMRSNVAGTLDAWHLAQDFNSAPILNESIINENPPMARVLAAGSLADGQQYLADIQYRRRAVRPVPLYGTPVSIGRF